MRAEKIYFPADRKSCGHNWLKKTSWSLNHHQPERAAKSQTYNNKQKRPVWESHFNRFACFLSKFFYLREGKSAVGVLTESRIAEFFVLSHTRGDEVHQGLYDRERHLKWHEYVLTLLFYKLLLTHLWHSFHVRRPPDWPFHAIFSRLEQHLDCWYLSNA